MSVDVTANFEHITRLVIEILLLILKRKNPDCDRSMVSDSVVVLLFIRYYFEFLQTH